MNSKEYFSKLSYLREAYHIAREEYDRAIQFDLKAESEKAAPHMIKAAQIVYEVLEKLAYDENFKMGLQEYSRDVRDIQEIVSRIIDDLSKLLEI